MERLIKVNESMKCHFEKKIKQLNGKCKKLNFPLANYEYVQEIFEPSIHNKMLDVKKYYIRVNYEIPKVKGYSVIAVIKHNVEGNIIKRVPQYQHIELDKKYWEIESICEHCNTNRIRKTTVLLIDESEKILQIGKSCLKEFLGVDITRALDMYEWLTEAEEEFWLPEGEGTEELYVRIDKFLNVAKDLIDKYGYEKKYNDYSEYNSKCTGEKTWNVINGFCANEEEEKIYNNQERKDVEVQEMIEYIKNSSNETDYIMNLKTIINIGYISSEEKNYLASLVVSFRKNKEFELKKKIKEENKEKIKNSITDGYFGNIKDKIEKTLTLLNEFSYNTKYGITRIYIFQDDEGYIYKWSTTNTMGYTDSENRTDWVKQGEKVRLKGTIKEHEEYRGQKQTVLTRCKPLEMIVNTEEGEKIFKAN